MPVAAARRIWVEISRPALRHNLAEARRHLPAGTELCAVVKADAYGHGAPECARVFERAGVRWLAVTSADEGVRLRRAGLRARILVLAGFTEPDADALVAHELTPAAWAPAQIAWLAAAVRRRRGRRPLPIHVKIDTGMGRLGASRRELSALAAALAAAPELRIEAVFSHLSEAEGPDPSVSVAQRRRFAFSCRALAAALHRPAADWPWHLLNSTAALRFADWGGAIARVGLTLYGYALLQPPPPLRPALAWKTRVVAVKHLPRGHGVGYGSRFRLPRPMRLATLAAGYADGYRRQLSPGASVLIHGQRAPVVGAISMDLTSVDVTGLPVAIGDTATLIGAEGAATVTAADLAAQSGTIPYEILCGISSRVARVYVDHP